MFKYLFLKFVELYNYFFSVYKFNIYKVGLTYTYDGKMRSTSSPRDSFWKFEKKYWLNHNIPEEHWTDVTRNFKDIPKAPRGVSEVLFRIKYWYRNKQFVCLTTNPHIDLANLKSKEAKFVMPINKVELLDKNGTSIRDVTKKFLKAYGPQSNFHNETSHKAYEIFYYNDYTDIKVTNILNQSKIISSTSLLHQFL
jgi:hypothetical protein